MKCQESQSSASTSGACCGPHFLNYHSVKTCIQRCRAEVFSEDWDFKWSGNSPSPISTWSGFSIPAHGLEVMICSSTQNFWMKSLKSDLKQARLHKEYGEKTQERLKAQGAKAKVWCYSTRCHCWLEVYLFSLETPSQVNMCKVPMSSSVNISYCFIIHEKGSYLVGIHPVKTSLLDDIYFPLLIVG